MTECNEIPEDLSTAFEQALIKQEQQMYNLRLYVAGANFNSANAIKNIKKICEQYLEGRYSLEVIDIYQQPDLLVQDNIFAIPTLVKELPLPLQKIIGDLSNTKQVIAALNIMSE